MLSIVVPVFDEEEVLPMFYERLARALSGLSCEAEILFVNDGSRDRTPELLEALAGKDPRVRVLTLTRNFGHQAALCAGLDHLAGQAAVILDVDLQDPPELIAKLLAKWQEGYQVVYAQRLRVNEGWLKRVVFAAFYRLLAGLANIPIPRDSGDFALMDRVVVDHLRALPERTRFLRGLRSWVGLRQTGVEYERPARQAGTSQYSLAKLLRLAFDGIFSFSTVPLKLALVLGLVVSAGGFLGICLAVYLRLAGTFDLPGWTSLFVVVLFLGGIQLVTIGILGEYIARIYDEVKRRPVYLVAHTLGPGLEAGLPAARPLAGVKEE